ncbi:MAG TPA: malonyl-CoA synthase [Gammaproteobacteria bacterium]|nr:malonyl-CoA synthase [Gammaproteobacteria bacterium]
MQRDDFNLYTHFSAQFTRRSENELLRTGDGDSLTYGQVDERAARTAAALGTLGVEPGERVSVQVEKSPEALILYLACLRAGFVYHPLNAAYRAAELEYFLTNAEPAVVVCDARNEVSVETLARKAGAGRVLTLNADGSGSLAELAADASANCATVPRVRDDLAALLYSSGTTGVPKGIMLTHGNLLSNTEALVSAWGFGTDDRLLHALPIFHVHGLFVAIGCALSAGASMRWLGSFRVDDVIRYLPECTVLMGVPTYYTRLLAAPELTRDVASGVRLFVSGSAPLLAETFADFEARTGHRILERYGMTETNMNTSNPLEGERKPGTVGPPLPGVEVRVRDDQGNLLGPGEIGNLEVRGPNVFVGYWKLPEKTAEDFSDDGFFNTGDKAMIDKDGYVAIVGRAKDVVITGGLNVYPKEVELVIDELPGVRESAVIGVPHPDFGEAVVAVVVCENGSGTDASRIIDGCKERLAGFKAPKRVVFVDELPRNTMAKVQKNLLRERFETLFEAASAQNADSGQPRARS